MESLGKSVIDTVGGKILIRSKKIPELYSNIATGEKTIIGKVNDVIGPVMNPHILVKLTGSAMKNPGLIHGQELYSLPALRKKKGVKRWKKKR